MAHIFSAYVVVDWSASSKKKLGKDSIWYSIVSRVEGNLEERMVKNVPTRKQLVTEIVQFCEKMQANRQNIFVGWDFSFGFPAGFYEALDLETLHDNPTPKWASIWDFLDSLIVDKDDNSNNRFQVAAEINRMVSNDCYPFWGKPASVNIPCLSAKKMVVTEKLLPELRITEQWCNAQSTWKLYTAGSVGSQTLLGIPHLRQIRFQGRLSDYVRIWPFETGLSLKSMANQESEGQNYKAIFAEVYPSLVKPLCQPREPKDAGQVRALAWHFAKLDDEGKLAQLFEGPLRSSQSSSNLEVELQVKRHKSLQNLSDVELNYILQEEGWILGV